MASTITRSAARAMGILSTSCRLVSESVKVLTAAFRWRGTVPRWIHPEELAAVETEIQRHPRAMNYRINSKHKRIEIYAKVGPDVVDLYHKLLAEGRALPGRETQIQEIDEQFAQFSPMLRYILIDAARRTFDAEHLTCRRGVDTWLSLGQTGSAAGLAKTFVPTLALKRLTTTTCISALVVRRDHFLHQAKDGSP